MDTKGKVLALQRSELTNLAAARKPSLVPERPVLTSRQWAHDLVKAHCQLHTQGCAKLDFTCVKQQCWTRECLLMSQRSPGTEGAPASPPRPQHKAGTQTHGSGGACRRARGTALCVKSGCDVNSSQKRSTLCKTFLHQKVCMTFLSGSLSFLQRRRWKAAPQNV